MACFADPTIILFLGGFVLAIAATKSGLDVMMAKALIAPFGKRSENVLLGFMLITGIFSMFISNTATAAMMLTFLTPVFKSLPPSGKGRVALTMAIPIGANLGGMGTPIGTPPNAFAFKVLNDPAGLNLGLSFGDWMLIMAPMVLIMLLMAWVIIRKMFPFSAKTIELNIEGNMQQQQAEHQLTQRQQRDIRHGARGFYHCAHSQCPRILSGDRVNTNATPKPIIMPRTAL
jgi:sodium-dependent dicarboxylate transporter 2/3/5